MSSDALTTNSLKEVVRNFVFPRISELFDTPGTTPWTCPAGITSVRVRAWGSGAGGITGSATVAGAGGGGAAAVDSVVSTTPGDVYDIIVPAGGIGGLFGVATNGADADFGSGLVTAKGGNASADGTTGGLGGLASASVGTTKFTGGNGGTGSATVAAGAGGGGGAGTAQNGGNGGNSGSTHGAGGSGGADNGGAGGDGGVSGGAGQTGNQYGGGGGGGGNLAGAGRAGARGAVQLNYQGGG